MPRHTGPKEHHKVTPCNISRERFTGRDGCAEAAYQVGWNRKGSRKRRHWLIIRGYNACAQQGFAARGDGRNVSHLVVDDGVATEIGCRDVVFQESLQKIRIHKLNLHECINQFICL